MKMADTLPSMTDEMLAVLLQKGNQDAFGELMRRYEPKLLRYGKRFIARSEDMEDVVQDVFLRTYENIQSYDPKYRFSPWIYRIAHNAYVNVIRKHSQRSFGFFDFDTLISPLSNQENKVKEGETLRKELEEGLDQIDPKYREIIILHYFEELSYDEIADVLHIPKGTVGVRLKRGREALRKIYEERQKGTH